MKFHEKLQIEIVYDQKYICANSCQNIKFQGYFHKYTHHHRFIHNSQGLEKKKAQQQERNEGNFSVYTLRYYANIREQKIMQFATTRLKWRVVC